MPFEEYEGKPAQGKTHNQEPKVSIRRTNTIGINKLAFERFIDEHIEHVTLLFNEEKDMLGIKPVESIDDNPNAYRISQAGKGGGGTVTPTSFLRHYELIHETTAHYKAQWDEEREMIIADITNTISKFGCRKVPADTTSE